MVDAALLLKGEGVESSNGQSAGVLLAAGLNDATAELIGSIARESDGAQPTNLVRVDQVCSTGGENAGFARARTGQNCKVPRSCDGPRLKRIEFQRICKSLCGFSRDVFRAIGLNRLGFAGAVRRFQSRS